MSDVSAIYGDFGLNEAAQRRQRLAQSLANQQASFLGQTRGRRRISDITRQYTEQFPRVQAEYGARGFGGPNVRSGIRQRGLAKYAEQFQRDIGDENLALQQELNDISMMESAGQADLDNYLNNLRLDKQRQIIESAAALQQYAGY
jgi:hypothetical protein